MTKSTVVAAGLTYRGRVAWVPWESVPLSRTGYRAADAYVCDTRTPIAVAEESPKSHSYAVIVRPGEKDREPSKLTPIRPCRGTKYAVGRITMTMDWDAAPEAPRLSETLSVTRYVPGPTYSWACRTPNVIGVESPQSHE